MNICDVSTAFWLELRVEESLYARACKAFRVPLPASARPRSVIRLWERTEADLPRPHQIHAILDEVEAHEALFHKLGISRTQLSLWVQCDSPEHAEEMEWDPHTFARLGEEGIRLCFTLRSAAAETPLPGLPPALVPVDICDLWIENEAPAGKPGSEVTVSLSDGTYWKAQFVSFDYLNQMIRGRDEWYWQPHTIFVPDACRNEIEKAVVDLLSRYTFEQAFAPLLDLETAAPEKRCEMEIRFPFGSPMPLALENRLLDTGLDLLREAPFWLLRSYRNPDESAREPLLALLDVAETQLTGLAAAGVSRRDLSLKGSWQFREQCQLEFDPELMLRFGKSGFTLRTLCRRETGVVARCLV
ncbi:MAG: hypothetical protein EAZ89_00105 [Bacteroidetes bacterium]|nr:MAG: hypothetical protein EAZ89_00105 [Bacteroidota bacterium]